ncbi:MAG: thiolase domain-containing protein [Candidatus Jordarchaeum sp.]|uniref:thiolase domain-containing protein n=1 Tax=Candidatus Jordarchaeum sp. TaxID=2823881 RepID=UPI00404A1AF2
MRRVAICGLSMCKVGNHYNKSLRELFAEATLDALESAGNPCIDAMYIGNMSASEQTYQKNIASLLSNSIGLNSKPSILLECADGSGGAALYEGYKAVSSGLHDIVLVGGVEKMSEATRGENRKIGSMIIEQECEAFHGLSLDGQFALIMRYYMHHYNVSKRHFALFAVQMHKHAAGNRYAHLPYEISVEDALNMQTIADPVTLFDTAPTGDGAAAVILCPLEKAREFTENPVEIAGAGQASDTLALYDRKNILTFRATVEASKIALESSKLKISDINFFEVHDSYTISGFLALEDLGIIERGKVGHAVEEGLIDLNGPLPTNLSGGLKARGHPMGATGVYQAVESALQLQGQAGKNQIDPAEVALIHNAAGIGSIVTVHVLKRV